MTKSEIIKAVSKAYGKPVRIGKTQYMACAPYDRLDGPVTEIYADNYDMLMLKLACRKAIDALVLMGYNADDVDYLINCEHRFGSNFRQMVHGIDQYLRA